MEDPHTRREFFTRLAKASAVGAATASFVLGQEQPAQSGDAMRAKLIEAAREIHKGKDLTELQEETLRAISDFCRVRNDNRPTVLTFGVSGSNKPGAKPDNQVVIFYDPNYESRKSKYPRKAQKYGEFLKGRMAAFRNVPINRDQTIQLGAEHRAGMFIYGQKNDWDYEYGQVEGYIETDYNNHVRNNGKVPQ